MNFGHIVQEFGPLGFAGKVAFGVVADELIKRCQRPCKFLVYMYTPAAPEEVQPFLKEQFPDVLGCGCKFGKDRSLSMTWFAFPCANEEDLQRTLAALRQEFDPFHLLWASAEEARALQPAMFVM